MNVHREPLFYRRALRGWLVCIAAVFLGMQARAQLVVVNETFRDTTFSGGSSWVVGGTNYTPNLTAASGVDSPGSGWLRLTSAGGQQATYAYDTDSFNGADATIAVKFSYAAYGGSGADGITFFLADASKTFSVGAYGGSLGYAQKTLAAGGEADIQGMNGGYIGLGIDEFGNYSNATEGRIGGIGFNPGNVSVRGPGSGYSGYDYLGGTGSLTTPIAFSGTSRPTGDNARIFQVVITATNQLTVYMQAGETAPMEALYSIDLSGYARPEDLVLGFTGSTGGSTNIHEIQGLSLTSLKADLWTNAGGTSTWANGGNWDGTDGNIPETGADILLNNRYVSTPQTIDVGGTRSIRSLQIDAPFAYTLNNGILQFNDQGVLGPSGIFVSKGNGSANHTLNSALEAQNAITITNTSTGTLQLNGTLATGGNAVTLSGTGNTNLSGVISGGGNLTKLGSGNATLAGNNTYSGGTTLQAGTLTAGHNNAFGTGDLTIKGGTLASNASNVIANNIALKGSAGLSNITTSGTLTQNGGNYTLAMTNATQSGIVNLSNNTTSRTLTIAVDSGTSTVSGVVQNGGGSAAGNLTKTGSGTLILSGANTYTGTTAIDAGTIQLGASDRLADTSSVSIGASGTLNLNGYSDKVGSLTAIGGATLNFGSPTGANTFVFGNYTAPASGVFVVNNWQQGVDTLATSVGGQNVSTVYFSGFGVAQIAGARSDNIYGTGTNGAYLLTPMAPTEIEWDGSTSTRWDTGSNWTSGAAPTTTQIALFDDAGLGRLAPAIRADTTIAGIRFGNNATASYNLTNSVNRTLTLSGTVPYIQQQSASNQAISIRTVALGSSTVADITGAGNLTISSTVSGTAALIKDGNGAGKLILSGNNTFTGGLYVNNGTAQANSNTALGTGTATVSPGATLEVSGSRTITNALSLSGAGVGGNGALRSVAGTNTFSGTITETGDTTIVADTGTTLNLTGNLTGTAIDTTFGGAGNFSINQITTGTGGVTLAGTGTLTMAGTTNANTYTGATAVNSGTLVLSKTAGTTALAGNLTIGDGAGAASSATVRLGAANQIADTSAVVLGSDGLLNLNGFAETIASLAGSGVIDNAGATATTLTFGDTGSTTFAGVIQDSGAGNLSLVKQGSGKITLSGANTYAGTTSLSNGIIAIQNNTALGSGAVTISSGANLEVAGSLTVANAIALNGPGTLANDGAIQSTAGNNTLTGNLTLQSASRLVADASSSLTLSGTAITSTAGSAQNLSFGGAGNITVNKVIGSATAANNVGTLTKDGDGTLVLTATNLYSGATAINAGTLEIRSNAGLGATAAGTTVANGATLALSNNITSAESQITLSGTGVGGAGALRNLSGTNTLSGAIVLNAASTIGVDAGALTASGVVSGANSLTKEGSGTLTLSGTGANTFSGGVTVNNGVLTLAKTAGVSAVGTGNVTIGDANGAANSAVIQLTNANQIGATANVTLNSDGQLNLNSRNETIGSLAGSGSVTLGTGNTLTVGNTTSTVFTGAVTTTGTGAVTKAGTGTLQIGGTSGSNSFAAATLNLNQGTVQLGASNILNTALNFNGGTFSVNGFDEKVTSATLTSSSILDFNSLSGVFDLSSGIYIGGTLTINGWAGSISGGGASQLLLGGTITGSLLANINFTGYGSGAQIVNGEIVPITGTVYTWKATGGGNWIADANWTPDPPNTNVGPTGTGISVIFGNAITGDSNVALTAAKTVGYMTFNDNNRYTISGSPVTMDVSSGSAQINVSNTGGGTISSNLALLDALQIAQNSSSQFIVSGNISGTATNLTVGGSGDTLISGIIATTTGTLTKNNTGTLTLSAANTFTGATTVNGGVLAISNENNLGANPAVLNAGQLTLNGGTLRTTTNAVTFDDANRGVTIGTNGGTFDTVSNLTIGGTGVATNVLAINGTLTKTGSGTLTFAGTGANTGNGSINVNAGALAITKSANVSALGDTAAVTVASGATLQFNGTGTYTAETIGSLAGAGAVTNASANAFTLTTGGAGTSTTFSGALQNTGGALSLTKTGAGTLTLTDTAGTSNYTGTTAVNAGVLNIRAATALGSTTGGTMVASGAALELQGDIAVGTEALSLTGTGVGTNGALRNVSGNNSFAGAITLGGATEIQSDSGTLTLSGGIGGTQNLTLAGVGNTTVSGVIATGTGTLTKADSGYAVLSGTNTFTGATSITGGTLEIRNAAALGTTAGATTVSAGGTLALSTGISTAEALTINGVGATSAGALRSLSGDNTVSGTVALASSSLVGVDADKLTVSGVVSGTGFTLTKVGAGTLALNATNTYSGGTAINAGTVQIAADRGLGAAPAAATPGNVTLNGGTLATTYNGALATNRGVALGAAGGAISPSVGTTLTYAGIIAGTGALTKSGDGTLTLTGTNTYSGGTALTGGTLSINSDARLGAVPGSPAANHLTFAGGTLATTATMALNPNRGVQVSGAGGKISVTDGTTLSFGGTITGPGELELALGGSGVFTLTNDINWSGGTLALGGGTFRLAGYDLSVGTFKITGNTILDFGSGLASSLTTANFIIQEGATLTIINWVNGTDQFLATNSFASSNGTQAQHNVTGTAPQNQVVFTGFGGNSTRWSSYNSEISPVPEPSTYGLILLGGCVGVFAWRRWRKPAAPRA